MTREHRARFEFLARAHRRAGRLTASGEDVAEALIKRLGASGQLDPSKDTLATDTGASERTVARELDKMRALGLVRWTRRLVRNGWRTEQTSNAYELLPDLVPNPPACGGHSGRETPREPSVRKPTPDPTALRAAQAALAAVRARMEARLALR